MNWRRHLNLQEELIQPACEWQCAPDAWSFVGIKQGQAYWLSTAKNVELESHALLVLPPAARGTLRASQIGPAQLQFFTFHPSGLTDLLSLLEREHLDEAVASSKSEGWLLSGEHPCSAAFAEFCKAKTNEDSLERRCKALAVVAMALSPELAGLKPISPGTRSAAERFAQLIQQLSEEEIVRKSPKDLARLCGCSLRHFTRLFHEKFGQTVRDRQTQLRLRKAQQLLCESDAKIINIALDCGYRHLGLFNAMFKKHLGITPSQWRHRRSREQANARKSAGRFIRLARLLTVAAIIASQMGSSLSAVTPPKAAPEETREQRIERIERELDAWRKARMPATAPTNAPVASEPASGLSDADRDARRAKWHLPPLAKATNEVSGKRFEIRGFNLMGNTILPQEMVDDVLDGYKGKDKTLEDIRAALGELALAYRARGYVTVALSLPPQTLADGVVKANVTEGKIADITVVSNRYYSIQNIQRALPSLKTNSILNNLVFQQELERANANRDRQIYPRVSPGPEPGTSSLKLVVKDRLPLHGRFDVNNYATPGTPDYRVGGALMYNNLWQLDHQMGVQYSCTPTAVKHEDLGANFLDQPLVANYSAFYKMPLNVSQSARANRDFTFADFGYDEATQKFRPPSYADNPELMIFASHSYSDTENQLIQDSLTPSTVPPGGALQVSDKVFNQTFSKNDGLGLRLQRPFEIGWATSLFAALGVDFKRYASHSLQNEVFQATLFVPPTPQTDPPTFTQFASPPTSTMRVVDTTVNYLPFSATLDFSRPDRYGSFDLLLSQSFNVSSLLASPKTFQAATGNAESTGNFLITTMALTREQKLVDDIYVRLRADGQWANEPLLNTEQFSLGGQAGPRGYRDGAAYFDRGWRVMLEPHTTLFDIGMVDGTNPMLVRLGIFTDYARGYYIAPAAGALSAESLWSMGINLNSTIGEHVDMRLTLGYVLQDSARFATGARAAFSFAVQF